MANGRARAVERRKPLAAGVAWVAVALACLILIDPGALVVPGTTARSERSLQATDLPAIDVGLSVQPGSWVLDAGSSATFTANLVPTPAACSITPSAVGWALPGYSAELGLLSATTGPTVQFTALEGTTGEAIVQATVIAQATCGSSSTVVEGEANATVVIDPALSLSQVTVNPGVATPGSLVTVGWDLAGGLPPYTVRVDYGDGNATDLTVPSAGVGAIGHRFGDGLYSPSVSVTDTLGSSAIASPAEPLAVASTLAVVVTTSESEVDQGAVVTFGTNVSGGVGPYFDEWTVLGASGSSSPTIGTTFTVGPVSGGSVTVQVTVSDSLGENATSRRTLAIAERPSVGLPGEIAHGDVGTAIPLVLNVSGGVAPYFLTWTVSDASAGNLSAPNAGPVAVPLDPTSAGPAFASVWLVDATGDRSFAAGLVAEWNDPPVAYLATITGLSEAGVPVGGTISVVGGTPPFGYVVTAEEPLTNSSGLSGTLPVASSSSFAASFAGAGNGTLSAIVRDAEGVVAEVSSTVRLLPSVSATLRLATFEPTSGAPLDFEAEVSGGAPPYQLSLSASDGEVAWANASSLGGTSLALRPSASGLLSVQLVVTDGLGGRAVVPTTVLITPAGTSPEEPPRSSPAGTSDLGVTAGVAAAAGGVSAAAVVLLGRLNLGRSAVEPRGPNALETVRRLLRASDGIEIETLEVLAEEDGIDPESSRSAVERWTRAGRVRREEGLSGEQLLVWVPPGETAPATPARAASEESS